MNLYHYYDKTVGSFKNLSDNSIDNANKILREIAITKPNVQCSKRSSDYMYYRLNYENILRTEFTKMGGIIKRKSPHYMVVEHCPWLSTWFDNCSYVKIPIEKFDLRTVSFTYGDSHPTFSDRVNDEKEYRKKLYTYNQILKIINKYGLPQDWNSDGRFGPERYIEAHIWTDDVISEYLV